MPEKSGPTARPGRCRPYDRQRNPRPSDGVAELIAGYRSLAGAEGDGRYRLDHLRQAEEQNERQHFRVLGAQQPRHQQVIERQSDDRERQEGYRDRRNGIEGKQREQPERQECAQHQEIAMRQIDDAHDAEHEVEPEPDQGEVEPEQQTGEQAVGEHSARSAAVGLGSSQPRNCHGRG